jgi:hypothetical protein
MSQVINTDTAIRGGQFICGSDTAGSVGVAGIAAMGFGLSSAMEGAAAFKAPVLIGDPNTFVSPIKQGSVMITRRALGDPGSLGLQNQPIISVQNTVPATLPFDVLLGNMDTPVGVTMFTGITPGLSGVKQISTPTIKQTGPEGQTFITVIKSHVEAFLEDIGIKNFTGVKMENGVDTNMALEVGNAPSVNATIQKGTDIVSSITTLNATHAIATKALALAGKGFDIPHPTKDDHRLRYICLEGPEVGAYLRGTLKDSDTIELPDYWKELVYEDSITVNLTPIGRFQELFVEEHVEWGTRIKVRSASGSSVHCHYTVFGERKTEDKLQVEYEGLTPGDYPGDNSEYALAGWDYARPGERPGQKPKT